MSLDFGQFIGDLLDNMNPYLQPNLVIVMDNALAHQFDGL
jgi:hypothetical protein